MQIYWKEIALFFASQIYIDIFSSLKKERTNYRGIAWKGKYRED